MTFTNEYMAPGVKVPSLILFFWGGVIDFSPEEDKMEHSTLNPQPSNLNPQPSTDTQPSTLNTEP